MNIIRGLHNCHPRHQGCVVTIGNFDGVHLGHRSLLKKLDLDAQTSGLLKTLIVFEPQPLEYFNSDQAPARLTRFREKVRLLEQTNLDQLLSLAFNDRLSKLSAEGIVEQVLVKALATRYLVIGDDFRFGSERRGDFDLLVRLGQQYGFEVERLDTLLVDSVRVSSSSVREALAASDFHKAESLLGHPYFIRGRVVHGRKLARTFGVRTANIRLQRLASPLGGVFLVAVAGLEGAPRFGLANLGVRPTLKDPSLMLEVHLLNWDQELYGRELKVRFLKKIREEQSFRDLSTLKQQIHQDLATTQTWIQEKELQSMCREPF